MSIEIIRDCFGVAAFASVVIGCWWLHPAAALIIGGGLILLGLVWPRKKDEHGDS